MSITDQQTNESEAIRISEARRREVEHVAKGGKLSVQLDPDQLELVISALDSHKYWQLADESYRSNGFVEEPGSDDEEAVEEIERCDHLHNVLETRMQQFRVARDEAFAAEAKYNLKTYPAWVPYRDQTPQPGQKPLWSGDQTGYAKPPELGTEVEGHGRLGKGKVVGYFVESGYLGVEVKLAKAFDNGQEKVKVVSLMGAELKKKVR